MEPLLHVLERVEVSDIVHDDDAVCPPIVRGRDGAEALLAGSVPDLQFDRLAIEVDRADLEVHTDGGDVALGVGVVRETKEKARLDSKKKQKRVRKSRKSASPQVHKHSNARPLHRDRRTTDLANTRVANQQQLEEVVILRARHFVKFFFCDCEQAHRRTQLLEAVLRQIPDRKTEILKQQVEHKARQKRSKLDDAPELDAAERRKRGKRSQRKTVCPTN